MTDKGRRELFFVLRSLFSLDKTTELVILLLQSESVTLSVDYLISSAQAGTAPAWVFLLTEFKTGLGRRARVIVSTIHWHLRDFVHEGYPGHDQTRAFAGSIEN